MAEIINLKRVRRARAQAQAKAKAAENRVVHGRTKAECARDSKQKAGHKPQARCIEARGTLIFVVSKMVAAVLEPTALMVELVLAGLLLRRKWLTTLGAVLLGACLLLPVDQWAVRPLEDRFPAIIDPPAKVDGIIVLGGAIDTITSQDRQTPTLNAAANRITTFVILAQRYPTAKLVFTGGTGAIEQDSGKEAPFAREMFASLGLAPARVIFEGESRTTWENAVDTNQLVRPQPGETWVLLTSAAHMPRSVGVFRAAGWQVVAWPVGYRSRDHISAWASSLGDKLAVLDNAAHEWTGLLVYWLQGPFQQPVSGALMANHCAPEEQATSFFEKRTRNFFAIINSSCFSTGAQYI